MGGCLSLLSLLSLLFFSFKMIKGNRNNKGGGRYGHTWCHQYTGWREAGGGWVFTHTEKLVGKISSKGLLLIL